MLNRAAVMAGLLALAACSTQTALTDTQTTPTSISLAAITLLAGDSVAPQIQVTVHGETRPATPDEIRITSSNLAVIIVAPNNALLAVGDGQSEITISWVATPSVSVTRTITITSESLTGLHLTARAAMVSGDTAGIEVTGSIRGGRSIAHPTSVTVASRNPAVASVSAGVVSAIASGQAWLVATATTGVSDSVQVSVVAGPPAHLVVSPETASLVAGQQLRIGVISISDRLGNSISDLTPVYASTAPTIALVQPDGVVMGVAAGSAMIVVTAGNAVDTLRLTVASAPLQILSVAPDSITLRPGDTARVVVNAFDTQSHAMTLPPLAWTSLTNGITVSASGLITASAGISTTISGGIVQVSSGSVTTQLRVAVVVTPAPVLLRLVAGPDSILLSPGGSAQIQVQAVDTRGLFITVPPLTWQSLTSGITVSPTGVISASSSIAVTIASGVVRVSSGAISTTIRVVVFVAPIPVPAPDGGYVQVRWVGAPPSAEVVAAFETARLRINAMFNGFGAVRPATMTIPAGTCMTGSPAINETIPGIVIFAQVTFIDGTGGILGSAGPCYVRNANWLPIIGTMQFDVSDINSMAANGTLTGVMEHEMMHTLGFGVIWGPGPQGQVASASGPDPRFVGVSAKSEYLALGAADAATGVPVENTGGSGTRGSHWRETVFRSELMTGWADGTLAISRVTIGALKDFGYDVDLNKADPFTLPGSLNGAGLRASQLIVETTRTPIGVVGTDGKITPYTGPVVH